MTHGLARDEAHADHGLPEPERGHLRVQRRAAVVGVLRGVVVRADVRGNADGRSAQERHGESHCRQRGSASQSTQCGLPTARSDLRA